MSSSLTQSGPTMTYREALDQSMRQALASNPKAFIMGQGVDDVKGTFGTTLNLHKEFGSNRIFDLPLAEEGMTGIAIGTALNGLYPIQTHIRADFVLLAMNQIINLAAKYRYMFGGKFQVPMLIRMVVGRSWGQGAQHSQSFQSLFGHIPGLTVIMPAHPATILESYDYAVNHYPNPVLSIEHRLMYDLQFALGSHPRAPGNPLASSFIVREGTDVTIVATSIMVLEALRAAEHLRQAAGINCEVIDLHSISHPDRQVVIRKRQENGKAHRGRYQLAGLRRCRRGLPMDCRGRAGNAATTGKDGRDGAGALPHSEDARRFVLPQSPDSLS